MEATPSYPLAYKEIKTEVKFCIHCSDSGIFIDNICWTCLCDSCTECLDKLKEKSRWR